jgi:hypothetical protein
MTGTFDNWTNEQWKGQFRTLRANSLAAIFELGKYVQEFRREFRAHPERWGGNAQWSTVCVNITGLSNSTCSMYETVWRVLGSVKECETHWKRDKLPSSLRTLYHIARAYEINPGTVVKAMMECTHCGSAFSEYPIHPNMSREDAERLVEEAKEFVAEEQADEEAKKAEAAAEVAVAKVIEDMKIWKVQFENNCLALGLSKEAIESLTWEARAFLDIYEHRHDEEYLAKTEEEAMKIIAECDKRIAELEGREGKGI